jgi:hypothetical protein
LSVSIPLLLGSLDNSYKIKKGWHHFLYIPYNLDKKKENEKEEEKNLVDR